MGPWSRFPDNNAPVAQLDRVLASEAKGCEFKSRRAHYYRAASEVPTTSINIIMESRDPDDSIIEIVYNDHRD